MAAPGEKAGVQTRDASRHQERAQRILDAAAALILRWGYNKTTIDDVARQAEVAKGTIYLHWRSREELFGALILREKIALAEDLKRQMATDPAAATLRGMLRCSALGLMKRPLMKAVFLQDMEVLGKLARSQHGNAVYQENLAGFKAYLELLREHGLVRSDQSLGLQVYVMSAVFMGFFVVSPLMPADLALSDEELANLLAETIHRALEPERPASLEEMKAASDSLARYIDRAVSTAEDEIGLRLGQ